MLPIERIREMWPGQCVLLWTNGKSGMALPLLNEDMREVAMAALRGEPEAVALLDDCCASMPEAQPSPK
jgi:hypothetical protein